MIRWLNLLLPHLSVERLRRAHPQPGPLALTIRQRQRDILAALSPEAAASGLKIGMTATEAQACCAELSFAAHQPDEDRRTQNEVATALLRFTPDVILDGANGFLLEIGRTSSHFGGETATLALIRERLHTWGFSARMAVAGRPMAARVLARAHDHVVQAAPEEEEAFWSAISWRVLPMEQDTQDTLRLLGFKTLADLLRLPRKAVEIRFGPELRRQLENLAGEREEILRRFRPREIWNTRLEWWPPTDQIGPVCFAAKRLLDLLEDHLASLQSGVVSLAVKLRYASNKQEITLRLQPTRPSGEARHLLKVLQHALEITPLRSAVDKITMECQQSAVLIQEQRSLFESPIRPVDDRALELCDRLRGRLGAAHVLQPELVAEHRPERAYTWRPPFSCESEPLTPCPGHRPLELLTKPEPLKIKTNADGYPLSVEDKGRNRDFLHILGPEKLNSGWWDQQDIDRLYFEVETDTHVRWWIFHDLKQDRWYHHGIFS